MALVKTFKGDYCKAFTLCTIGCAFSYISPFIINQMIGFLKDDNCEDEYYGYKLLAILGVTQLISYMVFEHMLFI